MTKKWLLRRLTHTCSIERDSGTARSSSGQVVASWSSVATSQQCRFAEKVESYANESNAEVTRYDALLLLPTDATPQIYDRVHTLKDSSKTSLGVGTYTIQELFKRRDWRGEVYHLSAGLEQVDTV